MVSFLKSCLCPQGHNRSEINPRNAFISIRESLSDIEGEENNSKTLKSNNLSPEKKLRKVSDVFDAIPQELIAHSYSSVASSITITPVIMQKKGQENKNKDANHKQSPIKRNHKILIKKIKGVEVDEYKEKFKEEQKKGGNMSPFIIEHQARLEKIDNLNFEEATKEYNKLDERGLINKK